MFDLNGTPTAVRLEAGDLVVYRGSVIPHWREQFQGDYNTQLILNYVSHDGNFADWAYDKRPGLAWPATPTALSSSKRVTRE